ncbi:MAG TPA: dihydrodipicolinate reductase C-terminal domain-containing protein [Thermoanaerobaculia bacterium]|nr:dihydrodipicolinate reductase C-terminal domain-containing protein [Thermoanaerobaculia bacterium]
MKIAVHGYGRMGHAVEKIARERGHEITATFSSSKPATREQLAGADVVIDFSNRAALEGLIEAMKGTGAALVIGTTGWTERREAIESSCHDGGIAMVHASNFSPGANILFSLARAAARQFASISGYQAGIEERHHAKKLDSPSGTALRIKAEVVEGSGGALDPQVAASRAGAEVGLHTLFFDSPDDLVEITHRARNRDGFARGAVLAAERIHGMSGVYRFDELLQVGEKS